MLVQMKRALRRRGSVAVVAALASLLGGAACGGATPRTPLPVATSEPEAPPIAAVAEAPLGADWVSSPLRVTDASGADLRLTTLHSTTVVQDPIATTELRVLVENPLDAPADARLVMTLPRRARANAISVKRGETVTELSARRADDARLSFEDYAAVALEPLPLVARDAGSIDALLPTLAKGERVEVSITYTELLSGDPLVVHLRGLPALDVLDVRVSAADATAPIAEVNLAGARPDADLVVPAANYRAGEDGAHGLVAASDLVAFRVVLPDRLADADPLVAPIFLVDTSAPAALELGRSITALRALVRALPAELPIQVATFDQTVETIFDGRAGDFGEAVESAIRTRHALGAADLEKALRWAAHEASGSKGERRLVLFTSGNTAAGEIDGIPSALKALGDAGVSRRDVIAPRVGRDSARLEALARGDDGRGIVLDVDLDGEVLARRLQRKTLGPIPISVAGASDVFPHEVDDGRAGDPITIVARIPSAGAKVMVTAGITRFDVTLAKGATTDLSPFFAAQKAALFGPAGGGAPRAVLADAVTSGRFVISNVASTLGPDALSTDPMNGAIGATTAPTRIDEAPADVVEPIASLEKEPKEPEDQPTIPSGRIPADTIRRIVRINSGRFKSCYIDLLRRKPRTSGRIVTSFRISADGTVADASIVDASSDIRDSETSLCVTTAFSKLSFPSRGPRRSRSSTRCASPPRRRPTSRRVRGSSPARRRPRLPNGARRTSTSIRSTVGGSSA